MKIKYGNFCYFFFLIHNHIHINYSKGIGEYPLNKNLLKMFFKQLIIFLSLLWFQ